MTNVEFSDRSPSPRLLLFPVLVALLLSGCRTYGGYESEEVLYQEIQRVAERIEEDVADARADLALLEQASSTSPYLGLVAEHLTGILEIHEAFLAEQEEALAQLSPGSSHRDLYRTFGAMVSTRRNLQKQVQRLIETAYGAYQAVAVQGPDLETPYANVPPYYVRVSGEQSTVTIQDLLRIAQSGRTPSPEAYALIESPIPSPSAEGEDGGAEEDTSGTAAE